MQKSFSRFMHIAFKSNNKINIQDFVLSLLYLSLLQLEV